MTLKALQPRLKIADVSIARVPPKKADPVYLSGDWKERRARIFKRDRGTCVVPGCGKPAKVCEHIVSRRGGGSDDDSNLCSLCRYHDNHFKEQPDGTRRNAFEWARIFQRGVGG